MRVWRHPFCCLAAALLAVFSVWRPANASCIGLACSCSVSAEPLNFGVYDPFSSAHDDTVGRVTVRCGALILGAFISYEIRLSSGAGGTVAARRMSNGGDALGYNLYTDVGRNSVWGDGAGSATVSDSYTLQLLLNETRDYTVYGRIPAGQSVSAGVYTDSIVVQIDF